MPGDIPIKSIQELASFYKRTKVAEGRPQDFPVDKVEKEVGEMINKIMETVGKEMFPEDKSTAWADVVTRSTPLLQQYNLAILSAAVQAAAQNQPADALHIDSKKVKSFIKRSSGKKVAVSDDTIQRTSIFLANAIMGMLAAAAAKTAEGGKVIMSTKNFYDSIVDDGSAVGKAVTQNHAFFGLLRAKGKSIKISKSRSKSRKSKKSKSRKSKKSSKRCSSGKHYRKGYKSVSGKRVKGKCVKDARKSRSKSRSRR
jgi:hypothetical protein